MFVILTYDVGTKRVSRIMRTVKKYLRRRQRSVFDGDITEGRLNELKRELEPLVEPEKDSIIIYKVSSDKLIKTDEIGVIKRVETGIL